jgi:hypothetical protein
MTHKKKKKAQLFHLFYAFPQPHQDHSTHLHFRRYFHDAVLLADKDTRQRLATMT